LGLVLRSGIFVKHGGSERRQLNIAMLARPCCIRARELLMLDEPTIHLDIASGRVAEGILKSYSALTSSFRMTGFFLIR
jgi:ATPase subunit of ABC transporter with duplicated ATPase domains